MFEKGIKISWWHPTEYINIDLDSLSTDVKIKTTNEWWPKKKKILHYTTSSDITQHVDGVFTLTIRYTPENNPHLPNENTYWGTSTIVIEPGAQSGTATWDGADNHDYDGTVKWTRLDGLFKAKKRTTTTKMEREQTQFRAALLSIDSCCAISGETTEATLEAAHIIASKHGGAEVIENGILLRADLHRLMDTNKIKIQQDGHVVITGQLSDDYKKLLYGKKLQPTILNRIAQALAKAEELGPVASTE